MPLVSVESRVTWGDVVRVWRAPGVRCVGRCRWGMLGDPFHTEPIHSDTLDGLSTLHADRKKLHFRHAILWGGCSYLQPRSDSQCVQS